MANTQNLEAQPVLKNFVPYKPKKNEVYMNEKQREHFKTILLDWRNQLMQEVDRTVHHMQTMPPTTLILQIAPPRKKSSAWSCVLVIENASLSRR